MPYVLGTDEAGYGPNLGPLVVAASLWQVPKECFDGDLYELFHPAIVPARTASYRASVAVADSKRLYSAGRGLAELERSVLALARTLGYEPACDNNLWQQLDDGESLAQQAELPWHARPVVLPHAAAASELPPLAAALNNQFATARGRLVGLAATAIFPARFNRLVRQQGSKAEVLSQTTLQLAARLIPQADEPLLVVCDKHGGRGKYAALLMQQFSSGLVEVLRESRPLSAYRLRGGPGGGTIEFRFQMQGEQFLPTALASMTAKYLRELAMAAFNGFWQRHVPNLKPTAGYPQDARRYKLAIETMQRQLAIADDLLWRVK